MDHKTFDEMIDWLEEQKGYDMSDNAKGLYWDAFAEVPDEMFRAAMRSVAEYLRAFPTIGEIRRQMVKGQGRRPTGHPHTSKGAAMARETAELIRRLDLSEGEPDKLTPEQYLAELQQMEEKYPGVGWAEQAENYERQLVIIKARKEKAKNEVTPD